MNFRLALWFTLCLSCGDAAAGLLASSTRVIYEAGMREQSLMLANTNPYPVLVQIWIDKGSGDLESAKAPFVVLPAIFRLQPRALQGVRILYNGDTLPQDRESVFWINLYEIPPTLSGARTTAQVELAMNTQLKVFYRPADLNMSPEMMASNISFSLERTRGEWSLVCDNPTPYHASFTSIEVRSEGHTLKVEQEMDMMTAPFDQRRYYFEPLDFPLKGGRVHFGLVDDSGYVVEGDVDLDI
ncbi:TPA: fimbrial biogenesis chaperone [Pseudomonas aeruginosa]